MNKSVLFDTSKPIFLANYSNEVPSESDLNGAQTVTEESGGRVTLKEYYQSYNDVSDEFEGKLREEEFTYSGNNLSSVTVRWYLTDGSVGATDTVTWQVSGSNPSITRKKIIRS